MNAETRRLIEEMIKADRPIETLMELKLRWDDEKEYEDWADYESEMAKLVPAGLTFIGGRKRPFGMLVTDSEAKISVLVYLKPKGRNQMTITAKVHAIAK